MNNYKTQIESYLTDEITTILTLNIEEINKAVNTLLAAESDRRTIFCFGNGGSASTASHF